MIPKINRFPTRIPGSFFATAKKLYSPSLVLYLQSHLGREAQVAVIVPKKVVSKATKRSEIKRLLKNQLLPHLEKLQGLQVVLYLKSLKKDQTRQVLIEEISELMGRVLNS